MFSWLGRLIFTSTALAPVGVTLSWALRLDNPQASAIFALTVVGLVAIAALFLDVAAKGFEQIEISPSSVEAADQENVAFLVLYLSPLFSAPMSSLNWSIIGPALIVFFAVTASGYNYHFSPLLGLMGWHSYRVTDQAGVTYVIFTRNQMRSAVRPLTAVQLTEYVLLDLSRK